MRPSTSTIWSGLGGRLQSWLRRSIAQPGCWRALADDGGKRGHSDPEDSAFGSRCDLSRVISDCESIRRDTPVFLAHLGLPSKRAQPHCREDCHVCVWHPVVFMFFGRFVLNFFGISLPVLKIAGGLIVAHTAWGMVTASTRMTPAESDEAAEKNDISLTPMAMPMLSGPGSIGVVMGLAANADSMVTYLGMVVGIAALGLSVYLFLRLGGPLVARLGPGAVAGITRIFGFLIFAVAVQLVWDGVADFQS